MTKRNPLVCGFQLAELCELWLRGLVCEHAGPGCVRERVCHIYGGEKNPTIALVMVMELVTYSILQSVKVVVL